MENTIDEIYIPREVYNEIHKMLNNYKSIDELIEKRLDQMRKIYINNMSVTNQSYLKSYQIENNILENVIIKLDNDWKVKRYKTFQAIINAYVSELYDKEDKLDYCLVKYRYFDKKTQEFIIEKTNLEVAELKRRYKKIVYDIYLIALKKGLYKEVV